jgi:hypothetical protein
MMAHTRSDDCLKNDSSQQDNKAPPKEGKKEGKGMGSIPIGYQLSAMDSSSAATDTQQGSPYEKVRATFTRSTLPYVENKRPPGSQPNAQATDPQGPNHSQSPSRKMAIERRRLLVMVSKIDVRRR